ncbi:MAG: DUF2345 domain-containing protein, partial [Spirochaetota bacterium]|nr:DUF2345 domain-containing protein [Spirochaetota bacterium]
DTKENKITISSDKDIEILAKNGKVTIDAKELELKTADKVKLEGGADIDMEASGKMNIKGATVNLN